ncbi:hypothetical protein CL634_10140 [bacterium]|nr:hypothetical protein [bacterium]
MDDIDLINNIKKNVKANESLNILYEKHSGIYCRMVNSYVPQGASFADRQEMIDDAKYYIYCAALKYDQEKNTKFSTYLGNVTRWQCLNIYNKSKKKEEYSGDEFRFNDISCSTNHFIEELSNKELIEKVFESIEKTGDKRAYEIFNMRYIIGRNNKVMPWKEIGKELKLSIQGCINIHDNFIRKIKRKKIK